MHVRGEVELGCNQAHKESKQQTSGLLGGWVGERMCGIGEEVSYMEWGGWVSFIQKLRIGR